VPVDGKPAAVLAAPLTITLLLVILPPCSATPMFWRAVARKPAEVLTAPVDAT